MGLRIDIVQSKFPNHYQEKMLLGAPVPRKDFMPSVLSALSRYKRWYGCKCVVSSTVLGQVKIEMILGNL